MDTQNLSSARDSGLHAQLAKRFVEAESEGGFVYYKEGYDCLARPGCWEEVSTDRSVVPAATTYASEGKLFVERIYETGRDPGRLGRLLRITERPYEGLRFEEIVGFRAVSGKDDLIYHACSPGLSLDNITDRSPTPLGQEISRLVAEAMRELHDKGVQYTDAVPTNYKYALGDRVILKPHNCMNTLPRGPPALKQVVEDLGIVLHTHTYITDRPGFVTSYSLRNAGVADADFYMRVIEFARYVPALISSGELPVADVWARAAPSHPYG